MGRIAGSVGDPPSLKVVDGLVYVNTADGFLQAVAAPE